MTEAADPPPISLQRQADAVRMEHMGLRDVVARRSARPSPADELSRIRITELEAAEKTLRWVGRNIDPIRDFIAARDQSGGPSE